MSVDYYAVDGYHGGKYGHMPLGAFRDILQKLRENPDWKLSLDIEPVSWDDLKLRDPATYAQLRQMLMDGQSPRLEIVSATYAQPYPWLTDGESFIRQMRGGLKKTAEHFPFLRVTTYAVQEPCWTSALPQLLRSFGFELAVLKNPSTAWAGYCEGAEGEMRTWIGPDGTSIPAVPRYACEGLLTTWQTESVFARQGFVERCRRSGVARPAGMCFQDLGWPACPYVTQPFFVEYLPEEMLAKGSVRYTTWKEYAQTIADAPAPAWRVSQEAFRVALPWGDQQLTHMARMVRRGENALLEAQWLDTLRFARTGRSAGGVLEQAAEQMMLAQHHDAWICASCGEEEKNWAKVTCARVLSAEHLLEGACRDALLDLTGPVASAAGPDAQDALLVNTLARAEERLVSVPVTFGRGVRGARVWQGGIEAPCQFICERAYEDGSWNAGTLLARVRVDGMGTDALRVEPLPQEEKRPPLASATVADDTATLENELYRITLDLRRGGAVAAFICKADGRNLVDAASDKPFNGFVGYAIDARKWVSSADTAATAQAELSGPLAARVRLCGKVGDIPFTQTLTLRAGERALTVEAEFDFPEKTHIGEDFPIADENALVERHRSYHDGRYKLNAYFPTAFRQERLFKDAAFDVCESRQADTYFQRWDEIKHNILISFVDVCDQERGLAVFSDHTTSYIHGADEPLGLTVAWAADGGYWWRNRALSGRHTVRYAILPHMGDWRAAGLWHEGQKLRHPVLARQAGGLCENAAFTLLRVTHGEAELSETIAEADGVTLRLFNPGEAETQRLWLSDAFLPEITLCELDGRAVSTLRATRGAQGGLILALPMPRFAVRSLRLTKKVMKEE